MSFIASIRYCLSNYKTFQGRGSRSEYWWFFVFAAVVTNLGTLIDTAVSLPVFGLIASLALAIPSVAAATRRLHDSDRSGWWQLLLFLPILGWIWLFVLLVLAGTPGPNRFGAEAPLTA